MIKQCAKILTKCGYATSCYELGRIWLRFKGTDKEHEHVDPFADTLSGRRQADALEDYFNVHTHLWRDSRNAVCFETQSGHKWRLDRIKWCIEQLTE